MRNQDSRPYSVARLTRLIKHFGSISKTARAAKLSPTTLIKHRNGSRPKISGIVCTALDLLYIRTF